MITTDDIDLGKLVSLDLDPDMDSWAVQKGKDRAYIVGYVVGMTDESLLLRRPSKKEMKDIVALAEFDESRWRSPIKRIDYKAIRRIFYFPETL